VVDTYYFETLNTVGQRQSGLIRADSAEKACQIIRSVDMFPLVVRKAREDEISVGDMEFLDANKGPGGTYEVQPGAVFAKEDELGAGPSAECYLLEGGRRIKGKLSLRVKSDKLYVSFVRAGKLCEEVPEYIKIPLSAITKISTSGFVSQRLSIEMEKTRRYVFGGNNTELTRLREFLRWCLSTGPVVPVKCYRPN
jgi:hypothetical protein